MPERNAFGEKPKSSPCAPCDECRAVPSLASESPGAMIGQIASGRGRGIARAFLQNHIPRGCAGAMLKRNAFGENLKSSPCTQCDQWQAVPSLASESPGAMIGQIVPGRSRGLARAFLQNQIREGALARCSSAMHSERN